MKKIIILVVGLLFIAVNLYAAGDLVVNGQLSVGKKISAVSTNERKGLVAIATLDQDGVLEDNWIMGANYVANLSGSSTGSLYGMSAIMGLANTAPTANFLVAADFTAQIGRPDTPGTTTVTKITGFQYTLNRHYNNQRTYNITDSYGIYSTMSEGSPNGTAVNITNHYQHFAGDPGGLTKINISNLAGMWITKQSSGTSNNYGLVLDGDGDGADVVFGPNQEARIYSSSGRLYAQDSFGNQTILSPHDPETGEWIYYSKNIKTGKIVKVDMERLVKAVERLTGETFMAETLTEDK